MNNRGPMARRRTPVRDAIRFVADTLGWLVVCALALALLYLPRPYWP